MRRKLPLPSQRGTSRQFALDHGTPPLSRATTSHPYPKHAPTHHSARPETVRVSEVPDAKEPRSERWAGRVVIFGPAGAAQGLELLRGCRATECSYTCIDDGSGRGGEQMRLNLRVGESCERRSRPQWSLLPHLPLHAAYLLWPAVLYPQSGRSALALANGLQLLTCVRH